MNSELAGPLDLRARNDASRHWAWKIGRAIPPGMRRRLMTAGSSALVMLRKRRHSVQPGPVTVAGLLQSTAGVGQAARLTLAAFRALGLDTRHLDLCRLLHINEHVAGNHGPEARPDEGGTTILQLNPPQMPLALALLGGEFVRGRRLIGYWAWELQQVPAWWSMAFKCIDELWAPSQFVARALRKEAQVPVKVVRHPVQRPIASRLTRRDFGIPEDAFVCLSALDARSGITRKNPLGAVKAFRRAFGRDPRHVLVLKINEAQMAPVVMARLQEEAAASGNIRLILAKYQPQDMAALIACSDVVLSLHRSEGFGLLLAEAMLLGKPVVATGWSGNLDFMNSANSVLVDFELVGVRDAQGIYTQRDQLWAEPSMQSAAASLQELASNSTLRARVGHRAQRDAAQFFNLDSFRREVGDLG